MSYAQIDASFELPDNTVPIDIISIDEGFIQLVTNNGMFELQNGEFVQIKKFSEAQLILPRQNYSSGSQSFYYPTTSKGIYSIHKDNQECVDLNINTQGILFENQQKFFVADENLYEFEDNKWRRLKMLEKQNFTDVSYQNDNIILSTAQNGIYFLNADQSIQNYTAADGLFSNETTSIFASSESIIVGHKNGISKIKGSEIDIVNLQDDISDEPIIEVEMIQDEIWLLTPTQLIKEQSRTSYINSSILSEHEELLSILPIANSMWVLSTEKLYYISDLGLRKIKIDEGESAPSFYEIRNNKYLTNGAQVLKYDKADNDWKLDALKIAPLKTFSNYKNVALVFEDHIKVLDTQNASLQEKLEFNLDNENLTDITGNIICTDKNVFEISNGNYLQLNSVENHFYKSIKNGKNIFIFSTSGIYKKNGETIEKLLDYKFNVSHLEKINSYILAVDQSNLIFYNTYLNELENLNLGSVKIKDIKIVGSEIAVLTERSLLLLDKIELNNSQIKINKTIPLFNVCSSAKIAHYEENFISILCNQSLFEIDLKSNRSFPIPLLKPSPVVDNNRISYKTNNHWTKDIKYNFDIISESNATSYWSQDQTLEVNKFGDDTKISAKMKDNIFGMPIFAPKVHIPKSPKSESMIGHIILIVFFSITCLFLWRFINRSRYD